MGESSGTVMRVNTRQRGRAVYLGRLVVLLVDGLQAAQQDQNLEGQGVPHDVDHHHDHIGRVCWSQ